MCIILPNLRKNAAKRKKLRHRALQSQILPRYGPRDLNTGVNLSIPVPALNQAVSKLQSVDTQGYVGNRISFQLVFIVSHVGQITVKHTE